MRIGLSLLAVGLLLAGCGRFKEVTMVDPRTGAKAFCRYTQNNGVATTDALAAVNVCVQELSYYGFQDEDALLAAARR